MFIKVGYELIYDCPAPTPMLLMLNIHYSHADEIVKPDLLVTDPTVMITPYRDGFGNWCSRLEAPAGRIRISTSAVVRSAGIPDPVRPLRPATSSPGTAGRHTSLFAGEPLLRNGSIG